VAACERLIRVGFLALAWPALGTPPRRTGGSTQRSTDKQRKEELPMPKKTKKDVGKDMGKKEKREKRDV